MISSILLVIVFVLSLCFYKWSRRPNHFPPGPLGLPFLGYLPFMKKDKYWPVTFERLAKKYGNIFSIPLGEHRVVVLNDCHVIKQAFRDDVFSDRAAMDVYKAFGQLRGKTGSFGMFTTNGAAWQEQRRFTMKQLREFGLGKQSLEPVYHDQLTQLTVILRRQNSKSMSPEKTKNLMSMMTLNIMWFMSAGEIFHLEDEKLIHLFKTVINDVDDSLISAAPIFFPTYVKLCPGRTGWTNYVNAIEAMRVFVKGRIDEHKRTYREDIIRDLIDAYIKEINETTDPSSSFYRDNGENHMLATLSELFFSGIATTATGLMYCFLYLCVFPEIQKKIQRAIDEAVGRDRMVSLQDRSALSYMDAFICELLRHSCPAPVGDFHQTSRDIDFRGYHLPKGTIVAANLHAAAYDPEFWHNPETFDPDRWLDSEGTLIKNDAFMVFGSGRRVCPGESFAKTSMYLILSGILQQFDLSVASGEEKPPLESPIGGLIHFPPPFNMVATPRK